MLEPAPLKGAALKEWLPSQLENNPDLTLEQHCQAFLDRAREEDLDRHDEPGDREPCGGVAT